MNHNEEYIFWKLRKLEELIAYIGSVAAAAYNQGPGQGGGPGGDGGYVISNRLMTPADAPPDINKPYMVWVPSESTLQIWNFNDHHWD